jgi:hypothetical protein
VGVGVVQGEELGDGRMDIRKIILKPVWALSYLFNDDRKEENISLHRRRKERWYDP